MTAVLLSIALLLSNPSNLQGLLRAATSTEADALQNLASEQLIAIADAESFLRSLQSQMKLDRKRPMDATTIRSIAAQLASFLPFDDLRRSIALLENSDPVIQMFGLQKLESSFQTSPRLKSDSPADLALRALYQEDLAAQLNQIHLQAEELRRSLQQKQMAKKNQDLTREILTRFAQN